MQVIYLRDTVGKKWDPAATEKEKQTRKSALLEFLSASNIALNN